MKHRSTVIIGNWKMNKTIAETREFISGLALVMSQSDFQVGLAVPFTMLPVAAETASETTIKIGAQNVSDQEKGAFTGEISARMIKDAGAVFSLVGHSERRHLFHEDDPLINEKIKKLLELKIQPIYCIGETLTEHQSRHAHSVLGNQMEQGLKGLSSNQIESLAIAYEPVWAIGTNQAATPDVVQDTHAFCRSFLAKKWGEKTADRVVIQYGGSVNSANAADLLNQPDVDGLLIGGASLSLDSFIKIVLTRISN